MARSVDPLVEAFKDFIEAEQFPCVGAKSALVRDALTVVRAGPIDTATSDLDLHRELAHFGAEVLDPQGPVVQSFVAIFDGPEDLEEAEFEKALWNRLQSLHNLDVASGNDWDSGTSDDPNSPHFSLCLAHESYFVIGLHPRASRPARRFAKPALVFNSHAQFEKLRADGRYARMQKIIREREIANNGSINPMLADFGLGAEAAQYSGREVGPDWQPAFERKELPKELQE